MGDFYPKDINANLSILDWLLKIKKGNTSHSAKPEEKVITVPIAAQQPATMQVPLTPEGNLPIVAKSSNTNDAGLILEKTTSKVDVDTGHTYGPLTEVETILTQGDGSSKEISSEEFKELTSKAKTIQDVNLLGGIIPDMEKDNQPTAADDMLDIKGKLNPYAGNAVVKIIPRCHPNKQLVIQESIFDDNRVTKETKITLAKETPHFAEENQPQATKNIVATGDEDIINAEAEVAHETGKNNSKIQLDVTKTLCESGFEKVQNTIAKNEGKYATENQIPIYTMLATSEHQSVVEEAARYIYTMQKENQLPAINITKEINNEGALRAAASQFNKYAQENQEAIKSSLMNTDYYSVKQEVMNQEQIKQDAADTQETPSASSAEENSRAEDNAKVINEVSEIINSNEPNKTELIENVIKNASETQKLTILRQCPNVDVIEALLNSNPSLDVLSEIMDLLGKGKFDDRNKRKLVNAIYKSGVFKGFNQESQIIFINNLDSENLKYIDIKNLSPDAKKVYDERLKDLQIREQTDISSKFSGFGLLKRTA